MIVGARNVNGFHGLLQFWSCRPIAGLTPGLGETRSFSVNV